jgi:hypothetical protein
MGLILDSSVVIKAERQGQRNGRAYPIDGADPTAQIPAKLVARLAGESRRVVALTAWQNPSFVWLAQTASPRDMKTTLEISAAIFRRAKSAAAERGIPLREFLTQAVRRNSNKSSDEIQSTQTSCFGNFPFRAPSTICFVSSEKSLLSIHSNRPGSSLAISLRERPLLLPNANVASLFRHSNFLSESTKRWSRWLQKPCSPSRSVGRSA